MQIAGYMLFFYFYLHSEQYYRGLVSDSTKGFFFLTSFPYPMKNHTPRPWSRWPREYHPWYCTEVILVWISDWYESRPVATLRSYIRKRIYLAFSEVQHPCWKSWQVLSLGRKLLMLQNFAPNILPLCVGGFTCGIMHELH